MIARTRRLFCYVYLWLLFACIFLPAPHAFSQPPNSPSAEQHASGRVAGRVVSATDGTPLPGAVVTLSGARSNRPAAEMVAGADGGFAFDHVAPGKYRLQGARHGYITSGYQQHEQFFTGIVTGTALDTESLVLRLAPEAAILGRITDEAGEPVRNARVTLYTEDHQSGTTRVVPQQSLQTEDLGSYEFYPLQPGTYFLAVLATPWYAVHPLHAAAGEAGAGVFDPALDVAYPMTFYAGATSSDEALPIPVRGGEQLSIDMQLTPQPAIRLTMPPVPGEQQPRIPQLEVPVFDGFEPVQADTQANAAAAAVVGLTPGRYRVSEIDPRTGSRTAATTVDLTRSTDLPASADAGGPGALTLQLADAGGARLPGQMMLRLRGPDRRNLGLVMQGSSQVTFPSVEPGSYQLSISASERFYYVVRMVADGKRLDGEIPVGSGGTTVVSIEIAASTGTVEGTVENSVEGKGQPAGGAMVVLVPLAPGADAERFRRDQSDLDGSFSLAGIVPGRYALVAIDDGWTLDWSRREVLARYLTHGVPVTVTGRETSAIRLPAPVPLQPR